jgi:DNA phosphorothioation-dependent restriction protein DptG
LFKFYGTYITTNNKEDSLKEENNTKENIDAKIRKVIVNKIDSEVKEAKVNTLVFGNKSEKDIMQTRITMAKELLSKNSEISFICDLTGLTLEQVNNLKQENI